MVSDPTRTFCKYTNKKKDGVIRMTILITIIIIHNSNDTVDGRNLAPPEMYKTL